MPGDNGVNGAFGSTSMEVSGLGYFNPMGDPNTLSSQWKRWVRAFNLYVTSRGVVADKQKVALLLHTGGIDLQDVFHTLVPDDSVSDVTYDECVRRLNEHLAPQLNIPFERHVFRQIQQLPNETVDQFVERLRQKAASCGFANVEAIRDQVIEKGSSNHLRRKFLEKSGNIALNEMQRIARAFEAVDLQMSSMEGDQGRSNHDTEVNAVDSKRKWNGKSWGIGRGHESRAQSNHDFNKCYRCNQTGHFARDLMCPAHDKTCKQWTLCGML